MRLAVDIKSLALHKTGISVYLTNLLAALTSVPADVAITLLGPRAALDRVPSRDHFEYVPLETRDSLRGGRIAWYDQVSLVRAVASIGADALFTPNCDAPVACGRPVMVTIHDLAYQRFPTAYPTLRRHYYGALARRHLRRAAVVLTDSRFSADELVAAEPSVRERLVVLPVALEPSFFLLADDGQVNAWCGGYGLTPGYFLYTGGFDPRKNVAGAVRGLAAWSARHNRSAVLALTGVGHVDARQIDELSRVGGSSVTLRLLPPLPREEMPMLYRGAGLVLYLSRYEGFALPVLEALAVGRPIVASPVGILASGDTPGVQIVREDRADAVADAIERAVREGDRADVAEARARFARGVQDAVRPALTLAFDRLRAAVARRAGRHA